MPDANPNTSDLFEIMGTTRSMRRLKPDPVPNDLIRKILEAGVCAPSGGNMQQWRFLVIRDAKVKETVGAYYKRAWDERVAPRYGRENRPLALAGSGSCGCSMWRNTWWRISLRPRCGASHAWKARHRPTPRGPRSIARALGLGATLTTLHLQFEKEAEAALGLPPGVHSYALLPIGYPMGRFGPVRRIPLADVVFEDRWCQPPYRD
jgi:nitroreductase